MTVIEIKDNPNLIPTSEFKYAHFPFEHFNTVQSAILEHVSNDTNITIASSTSSGKTVMAELYMADEIRRRKGKALYIGPLKALANEKQEDWTAKDHHFNDLNISICTGDHGITKSRIKEMNNADVIVMTPEMLASRCRNQKSEKSTFLKEVGTVVFDESHLLTVPNRGAHIEVALMKMVQINPNIRVVFLSATMPNVKEICSWLSFLTKRDTVLIESKYRPCPLKIHYETYWDGGSYENKENSKIGTAVGIINYYPNDKFLVFVHTKTTGKLMVEALKELGIDAEFHNADLNAAKRDKLEKAFKNDPNCRVIIATSTLAWGCYANGSLLTKNDNQLVKIENLNVGDELLCPINNKPTKILRKESFESDEGFYLKLESNESMVVSKDHIFLGKENNWVYVKDLKKGDYLKNPSNEYIQISEITSIKNKTIFHEIEVEDPHAYVGCGVISHNCNLPARRVIITGIHRGISVVENYDIGQMCVEENTRILMSDGSYKAIKDINIGDFVYGIDENQKLIKQEVVKIFKSVNTAKKITFTNKRSLVANNHPILTWPYESNFINSNDLKIGDQVSVISRLDCNPFRKGDTTYAEVESIEDIGLVSLYNLTVTGSSTFIAEDIVTHNCGRAGRPKYDPRGDVYILIPESHKEESIAKLQRSTKIISQLLDNSSGHYKTLAFHVVSEIHHKCIQTKDGFHKWFSNSLAHFQDQTFNDSVIDSVIDLLLKTRCITVENDVYQTTPIGTIASMFYFSPFDVADLRRNFKQVFDKNQENNDLAIAVALGNIDTYRFGIVNKNEKAEIVNLALKIEKIYGKGRISDSCIKAACAYYKMMTGQPSSNLGNLQSQLRLDLERTVEVINAIDQMSGKWNKKDYFYNLSKRISYGVKPELLDLIGLPGVGKARAERLHAAGISIDKIPTMTDESLSNIMKYKNLVEIQKIKNAAKISKLKGML